MKSYYRLCQSIIGQKKVFLNLILKLLNEKLSQQSGIFPFSCRNLLQVIFIPCLVLFDMLILKSLCLDVFIMLRFRCIHSSLCVWFVKWLVEYNEYLYLLNMSSVALFMILCRCTKNSEGSL